MSTLRTVIIEDEDIFRQLIVSTLSKVKNLDVIGEFELGKPGLKFCLQEKPDLAVIDLVLPDINGLEIATEIRRTMPQMHILILTAHPSERLPAELIALGVDGYVDKTAPRSYVLSAIDTIRRGGMFFASHVAVKGRPTPGTAGRSLDEVGLSDREKQIARLVAAGQISKEIAVSLNLSLRTVEKHRENLMAKIGVHEVASLTRWCIQVGLVDS
jgi:DNA-binding NarL/FixJ family response regulator